MGENQNGREHIDRMVKDIISDGKVKVDRAYEIARAAARRADGEAKPLENYSKDRGRR